MRFTVFTPTFNRAHTIARVFESLKKQTYKNFEWVVVDDGSSDGTDKLIAEWAKTAHFPIIYLKQENQGKHIAINKGLEVARGELFLIADSDDAFISKSLEIFVRTWETIDVDMRNDFTGVTALCMDADGRIIGDEYPEAKYDSTPAKTFYCLGIKGEKWGFHRTDILKKFKFPEISGFKFYPEGLIWNKIGRSYLTRYINIPLRYYYEDSGNQLTKRSPKATSPMYLFYAQALNEDCDYFFKAPLPFIKIGIQGARFSFHQSQNLTSQLEKLQSMRAKLVWCFAIPFGFVLYLFDKVRFE